MRGWFAAANDLRIDATAAREFPVQLGGIGTREFLTFFSRRLEGLIGYDPRTLVRGK